MAERLSDERIATLRAMLIEQGTDAPHTMWHHKLETCPHARCRWHAIRDAFYAALPDALDEIVALRADLAEARATIERYEATADVSVRDRQALAVKLDERDATIGALREALCSADASTNVTVGKTALDVAIDVRRILRAVLATPGTDHARRPKVVCLCGSTRFWEAFRDEGLRLTMEGVIVLSIGICAPDSMVLAHPDTPEGQEQKRRLDELHKRKIDLADEILVLNVDGYIGDSTRSEIGYARKIGKPVRWLVAALDAEEGR